MLDNNTMMRMRRDTMERAFRKYEDAIAKAVDAYPNGIRINPAPLKPTSYVSKLRDAKMSLFRGRWKTSIDLIKFDRIYDELQASEHGEYILFGTKEWIAIQTKLPTTPPEFAAVVTDLQLAIAKSRREAELDAKASQLLVLKIDSLPKTGLEFVNLLITEVLLRKILHVAKLTDEEVRWLQKKFDSKNLLPLPDGSYALGNSIDPSLFNIEPEFLLSEVSPATPEKPDYESKEFWESLFTPKAQPPSQ